MRRTAALTYMNGGGPFIAAHRLGLRVPEDLSIVTFANDTFSDVGRHLSTLLRLQRRPQAGDTRRLREWRAAASSNYDGRVPQPATRITSSTNPRVKAVARLRESRDRRETGLFIAEGEREVSRAIAAGLRVVEVWTCPELWNAEGWPSLGVAGGVARVETSAEVFRKIAYVREPVGLLAVVESPRWEADALPSADAGGEGGLVLVAVGTEKPGNLGAMVRTADAAGCAAVIAAGAPVDLFNPNTIRTSTGAVFTMPTLALPEDEAIGLLRKRGYRVAAAALVADSVPHTDADLRGAAAIVIGPEDTGLSDAWLRAADVRVRIPMRPRTVDSLNASNAAAILLFEAVRQRAAGGR